MTCILFIEVLVAVPVAPKVPNESDMPTWQKVAPLLAHVGNYITTAQCDHDSRVKLMAGLDQFWGEFRNSYKFKC